MKQINIASVLIRITLFFVVLTGLNISVFAILSFTNQTDLILNVAKEKVFNPAYELRNETAKIFKLKLGYPIDSALKKLEKLLLIKNTTMEDVRKMYTLEVETKMTEFLNLHTGLIDINDLLNEMKELINKDDVKLSEIEEKSKNIRNYIEKYIGNLINPELILTVEDITSLPEETMNNIRDGIADIIKTRKMKITRFKLFVVSNTKIEVQTHWGYEKIHYISPLPMEKIDRQLKTRIDKNILGKIETNALNILLEEVSNQTSSIQNDINFVKKQYKKNEKKGYYTLNKEINQDNYNKLSDIFNSFLNTIIKNYYIKSDKDKKYNLKLDLDVATKEKILSIAESFDLLIKKFEDSATKVSEDEIIKTQEIQYASMQNKLFVNDDLIDYIFMDVYIPIGQLTIKARIELPNSKDQFNSLLRLVLIAGTVIIIAHIIFIIIVFIVLVNPMKKANETLASQNKDLDAANKQFKEELEVARKVQEAILPNPENMPSERVDIGAVFDSLEEVSGDYLDVINLDANTVGILIVDVSGHGVPSALVTTMAKVAFNSYILEFRLDSDKIFDSVNKDLCKATGESDYYCTAVLCIVDMKTYEVSYSTGGHPKFLIYTVDAPKLINYEQFEKKVLSFISNEEDREFIQTTYEKENPENEKSDYILKNNIDEEKKNRIKEILDSVYYIEEFGTRGFMIGAAPFARYQKSFTKLHKGDKIIIFSDGIIEAEGPNDTMYEYDRLRKLIVDNKNLNSQELCELIHKDVMIFREDEPQSDDISIIILKAIEEPEIDEETEFTEEEFIMDEITKETEIDEIPPIEEEMEKNSEKLEKEKDQLKNFPF